jgi:class 3 adenylate cyclase
MDALRKHGHGLSAGRVAGGNLRGRLVDGFLRITDWSIQRRVNLVAGILIPYHLGYIYLIRSSFGDGSLVNMQLLEPLLWMWLAVIGLMFISTLRPSKRAKDSRWPVHMFIFGYGTFMFAFVYIFGTMSSPYISYYLVSIVLLLILFDSSAAVLAMGFGTVVTIVVGLLEVTGQIPHAPALVERSVDLQNTTAWFLTTFAWILMALFILLCLLALTTAARERARAAIERSDELIRRYVPPQIASKIMEGSDLDVLQTARRRLTIFFSDVEGFTALSDRIEPEVTSSVLNEYLSEMAMLANDFQGTLNEFIGDGLMILFGAPEATNDEDQAMRAVRMATRMQERMVDLNEKWFREGLDVPLRIRVGINTGIVSVGSFGSQGRMTYTAIGNQTNLAARIQAQCEAGKVLLGDSTWRLVREEIDCIPKGEIEVKGIHYPVQVHEVSMNRAAS